MKTFLFILFISAPSMLFGQLGKFSVGLEYSLSFTEVTQPFGFGESRGFQPAGNLLLRGGYKIGKMIELTMGAGYLVTDEFQRNFFSFQEDVDFTELLHTHQYFILPIGTRFTFGSFFIQSEIGLGFDKDHSALITNYILEENGVTAIGTTTGPGFGFGYNAVTIPVFLSFGAEINLKTCKILFGTKSYYSLNSMGTFGNQAGHYFGFGLLTGVKF